MRRSTRTSGRAASAATSSAAHSRPGLPSSVSVVPSRLPPGSGRSSARITRAPARAATPAAAMPAGPAPTTSTSQCACTAS
ncbi:hypothetical protein [Microbispora sp. GKU 823]|uniref:hypothetical protein n=1 Tax=Microbispora sp. GKU 823 TaxID=1652100 RepID=UPI00277B4D0E|nr:hypothetical protein [Microbispora sp. GKU 823]